MSPKVTFNTLTTLEEIELKDQLKLIQKEIVNNKNVDADSLYNDPKLKLNSIPKKDFDEIINQYRRNGYGKNPQTDGAYVVCGVVAVVAGTVMVNKVGSTMNNKVGNGGGDKGSEKFNQDVQKEELLKKIIPILPRNGGCDEK